MTKEQKEEYRWNLAREVLASMLSARRNDSKFIDEELVKHAVNYADTLIYALENDDYE